MITTGRIILRAKSVDDVYTDYAWETDPELARLDATTPLRTSFARYRADHAEEIRNPCPSSRRFAIQTTDGKHIGNCAYYNIKETDGETELGIMIGDRNYWNKGYGTEAVRTLLAYIFTNTELKRVHLKTLASNYRAQNCFLKAGFKPYVRLVQNGHDFIFMEIDRERWEDIERKSTRRSTPTC